MRDLRKEDELNRMMNGVGPQQQQNEQRQAPGFDAVNGHVDGQQRDKNRQFDFYESRLDVEGFVVRIKGRRNENSLLYRLGKF